MAQVDLLLTQVKLLSAQLDHYEWLLWLPVDAVFADASSSLSALISERRAHLIVLQDSGGDGMGSGILPEPLLIRGRSYLLTYLLTYLPTYLSRF